MRHGIARQVRVGSSCWGVAEKASAQEMEEGRFSRERRTDDTPVLGRVGKGGQLKVEVGKERRVCGRCEGVGVSPIEGAIGDPNDGRAEELRPHCKGQLKISISFPREEKRSSC